MVADSGAGRISRRPMTDASLRVKAAVVVVVMSVLPMAIVAVMNIHAARVRVFDNEAGLLAARAEQLVGLLDAFNLQYQRAASRLARTHEVIELLSAGNRDTESSTSSISSALAAHVDEDPAVRGIGILDRTG